MTNAKIVSTSSRASTTHKSSFYSSQKYFPLFLIAPTLLVIGFVILYPMLYSIYVSFTPFHLLRPEKTFVFSIDTMFNNYIRLMSDDVFWRSLLNTVIFLAVSVNVSFVLALAVSQLLARSTETGRPWRMPSSTAMARMRPSTWMCASPSRIRRSRLRSSTKETGITPHRSTPQPCRRTSKRPVGGDST